MSQLQKYPLYDYLKKLAEEKKDVTIDIKMLSTTINNIANVLNEEDAKNHYNEIGALIIHHEKVSNGGVMLSSLPYEGTVFRTGRGILYDIPKFPVLLQRILAQYVEMVAC